MSEPLSVRSRRAVDQRLDRLREAHGSFPFHTETVENNPSLFAHGRELFGTGGRGGAGARVTDTDGRVLLIRHPRDPDAWVLPGGGHEPGETFAETAAREVWEETGAECEITGVWQAKRRRFVHCEDLERRGYLLSVFFTAEYAGGAVGRYPERWDDADEVILEAAWFDDPPETAAGFVADPDVPQRDAVSED